MAVPFEPRPTLPSGPSGDVASHPNPHGRSDFRCSRCGKLLGLCSDGRKHLRLARRHEYFVGFPVQAICRSCGTLNETPGPAR